MRGDAAGSALLHCKQGGENARLYYVQGQQRQKEFAMCMPPAVVTALLLSGPCADSPAPDSPCLDRVNPGPALLTDPALHAAGHAGARVIDYGVREPASEFQGTLGVECRVLRDTVPVAQGIARPPPNQGSRQFPSPSFRRAMRDDPRLQTGYHDVEEAKRALPPSRSRRHAAAWLRVFLFEPHEPTGDP